MHAAPEISLSATRDQHDARAPARELFGDVETADVGEPDIEQDQIWVQVAHHLESRLAVRRFAHDVESVQFQETANRCSERRMVIDDEDGQDHTQIVTHHARPNHRAFP